MHTALVSRLMRDRSAWELTSVPAKAKATATGKKEEPVLTVAPTPALASI